ncbi:hypothetical protein [Azospirillum agricola]|uniref:hypothetical protein n=1 Tax=Azospirillum agricola TaxID=1720247 RepID=UPI000A0F17FB|nr:hypothetical protein [Azospirillum agricola]MBP2228860.1 hypothetical protein [Azospirillum agricola]SMH62606.1 hypothetical protein SAMN02982994_6411 [Azospirillum lipoferum]
MSDAAERFHPLNDNRHQAGQAGGDPPEGRSHGVPQDARAEVRERMAGAGFRPLDLGDGAHAWYRRAGDGGGHALVSHHNGLDGDPEAPDWIVGQYGERGGYIEVGGLTLSRALVGADTLPVPVRADGSLVEALYPSLQQALDDLG